jgi:hypothetical protein
MSCLPSRVTLRVKPNGALSQYYPVTPGQSYTVLDRMSDCFVIETDMPGQLASIHWSRFTSIPGSKAVVPTA